MRMSQSLAELESAFSEQTHVQRQQRRTVRTNVAQRAQRRRVEREHKRGSMRFAALVLALAGTAVGVTLLMFETLAFVMGAASVPSF